MRAPVVLLSALAIFTAAFPARGRAQAPGDLVARARIFMDAYQRDLSAFAVDSIIARYDPRGAVVVVGGQGGARTASQIADTYRSAPGGPSHFAWRDLVFQEVAPDAVLVRGGFLHQVRPAAALTFTYLAVLMWDGARLRIVLEREAPELSPGPP